MKDTQHTLNSEAWLSQSTGISYRAERQHPPVEPNTHRPIQKIQSQYHHREQAIEVEAIEIETIPTEAIERTTIEMQCIAYEIKPVQSSPIQTSSEQNSNPGLLDIGFWLNLPE
jgi:hypothetical protein